MNRSVAETSTRAFAARGLERVTPYRSSLGAFARRYNLYLEHGMYIHIRGDIAKSTERIADDTIQLLFVLIFFSRRIAGDREERTRSRERAMS